MINSTYILAYLTSNKERFINEYQIVKIGLFGSLARNEESENNDIDIIVEFKEGTQGLREKKEGLRKEIQNKFQLPVDICREKYIKPYFREQILTDTLYA